MDEERSGMECRTMNATESPIVSGIKEERKNQPARKDEQAGVLRNRVVERAKGYNVKLYFVERINAKASL